MNKVYQEILFNIYIAGILMRENESKMLKPPIFYRYRKYFYVRSSETPHCTCCGSSLRVIGSRSRVLKENDGSQKKLIIRRMRCDSCERIHHELPDILVPFKRYGSETIESVLTSPAVLLLDEPRTLRNGGKAWCSTQRCLRHEEPEPGCFVWTIQQVLLLILFHDLRQDRTVTG